MSNQQLPKFAALFKSAADKEPFAVTSNLTTMKFWSDQGAIIRGLVDAEAAANAIVAARAMYTIYHQCFQRGDFAKPGDKVMFDNDLFPLTPEEDHALLNVGITVGGVYTVSDIFKRKFENNIVELSFKGSNGSRRFRASKFVILPK